MPASNSCPNCDTNHGDEDLFCENCGYDFITGSLPSADSAHAPIPGAVASGEVEGQIRAMTVKIEVSPEYFAQAVSDTELQIPVPPPENVELRFESPEVHIGRTSESRGIHPDIDIAATTSDPAVSSRHAVLRVGHSGIVSITDLGSTNGTVIGDPSGELVTPNVPVDLTDDTWIYLGAWSRINARMS